MILDTLVIVLGGFAGGLVNGLTGFGTSLTGLPFWLVALPPVAAAQVAAACSVAGQAQTIHHVWPHISWRRALPLIAGGLAGVPVGTWMLPQVGVQDFKLLVGLILVGYCGAMLVVGPRPRSSFSSRGVDALVGFCSGILGGLAGLSGVLPVLYASLLGWSKEERRGVFQAFNGTILLTVVISSAIAGLTSRSVFIALLLALPGTVLGVRIGLAVYRRLDDLRFDRVVMIVLLLSGVAMIAAASLRG